MSLITELIAESCQKHAGKTAFRVKQQGQWRPILYDTLWDNSSRVANALLQWGLQGGDRCALLGASSPAWVEAYLAVLHAGGICVPVDKELKQGEIRHILIDCGARVLFTDKVHLEKINEILPDLPTLGKIVLLDQAPPDDSPFSPRTEAALGSLVKSWRDLAEKYQVTADDIQQLEDLAEGVHGLLLPANENLKHETGGGFLTRLLKSSQDRDDKNSAESLETFAADASTAPGAERQATDTAVILYTSGTTGRSKGAMLSHNNIVSNIQSAADVFGLDETMTTLSFLPINHVFEQVCGILLPLSIGGTINFAESLKKIGDNLGEVRPNFLLGVPAVFRLLQDRLTRKVQASPLSRGLFAFPLTRRLVTTKIQKAMGGQPVFVSGGAALDPVVARKLTELGVTIYQGYGITETSPVIAAESPRMTRLGTVGLPLPEVQVRIDQPNTEGVGEIWVKGPNVMQGYFNNPEATAEVLTDGWYHTGDLGRLDQDGALSICGRVKNLIVTANGKNVYPEEIENELLNSPFIEEIMVYGHKANNTVEEVHAMIYPCQEALDNHAREQALGTMSIHDVEELIRKEVLDYGKNLADYKRVRRFTIRDDEFPKTTTRKIKRFIVNADISTEHNH